jgi:hypothetical protein
VKKGDIERESECTRKKLEHGCNAAAATELAAV